MENDKKEKVLKIYEALNNETGIMLTLNRMNKKNLRLSVCEEEGYGIYLRDEVKEAVMRAACAYTKDRIMTLSKELEKLMQE